MPLGLYISVPFCRTKCSYCNFASGVFSASQMAHYVERLSADVAAVRGFAHEHNAEITEPVDTIYLGGGTPSLLPPDELKKLFFALRQQFKTLPKVEITVECAPGTLTDEIIQAMVTRGVNRVSLGVQSFIDKEAASVGRLHSREKIHDDIARLRKAGISNINIDLIAGLPHQTRASWDESLDQAIASGVPHVSVYMLEVDEDSRLGRELIAGGTRYHAHHVPDDDLTAEFYEIACASLNATSIQQYEISNFARAGFESRHNSKYWTREPYLGFGVDAHSMLPSSSPDAGIDCVRFSSVDVYDRFLVAPEIEISPVSKAQALEESFFLGLRLNRGINLGALRARFGECLNPHLPKIDELICDGLLVRNGDNLQLTPRGRLLSNEVFERFVSDEQIVAH
jgi:oxygen-independent coproporphyrinogen III oxidase